MGYDMVIRGTKGDGDDYFRANIYSMGDILRPVMQAKGLLDNNIDLGKFPSEKDFPDEQTYAVALSGYLAQRSQNQGQIPLDKFCSNDGWIVTSEECKIIFNALRYFRASDPANPEHDDHRKKETAQYIRSFAYFAARAAKKGGFEVW